MTARWSLQLSAVPVLDLEWPVESNSCSSSLPRALHRKPPERNRQARTCEQWLAAMSQERACWARLVSGRDLLEGNLCREENPRHTAWTSLLPAPTEKQQPHHSA